MRFTRWFTTLFSVLTFVGAGTPTLAAMHAKDLATALQHGGYVIVLRHAETNKSMKDKSTVDLADCDTQRVLTPKGRMNARTIGQSIDQLHIPIGEVIASPLCRTMWTAELAFGRAEANPRLREPKPKNAENARKAALALTPLLSRTPKNGMNTALITHGFNVQSVTGFLPAEGEAVIVKPASNGTFYRHGPAVVLATVVPWKQLVKSLIHAPGIVTAS